MKKHVIKQLVGASILAVVGLTAQAAGPDWSLIISGPALVIPPAPPPVQVAPVRVAPPLAVPAQVAPVQNGFRPDLGHIDRDRADRDGFHQERYRDYYQERENYYLERERAFLARERAFLERERQRQLVVENNHRASQAINDRQDQQLDRIVAGVNTNRISKDEFSALMAQQKDIRTQERSYLSDGFFSREEYQQLTAALDAADQAIRQNRRGRYPPPRFYPQSR